MKALSIVAVLCVAACSGASTATPPLSPPIGSQESATLPAGLYAVVTTAKDAAFPAASIAFELGPKGQCSGSASAAFFGTPPSRQRFYFRPLVVSTYKVQGSDVAIAGRASMGGALQTLNLRGTLTKRTFRVSYSDVLGKGSAVARYVAPCRGLTAGNPPNADLRGTWKLHIGRNDHGAYVAPVDATITIDYAQDDPYEKGLVDVDATLKTPISYATNPPYRMQGFYSYGRLDLGTKNAPATWDFTLQGWTPPNDAGGGYVVSPGGNQGVGPLSISR